MGLLAVGGAMESWPCLPLRSPLSHLAEEGGEGEGEREGGGREGIV